MKIQSNKGLVSDILLLSFPSSKFRCECVLIMIDRGKHIRGESERAGNVT